MKQSIGYALALAAPVLFTPLQASADPVRNFYSGPGKKMQFIIRSTTGGGYDLLSRLLARHLGRHIPGNPNLLPVNMPGGGGIVAANYLYTIAPKNGSVIEIISQGLFIDQTLGLSRQLRADLSKFNYIANVTHSNQVLVTWKTSKTKTLADAKGRVTTIGASGAGSSSVQLPALLNNLLGTKFKIIFGYRGGSAMDIAMERGEVEGRGSIPYADYVATKPGWIEQGTVVPLVQVGMKKEAKMPNVPLLLDQAVKPEDRPVLEFFSRAATIGRPLATAPGVPKERVAALRAAFQKTITDPKFIEDARRMKMDISPMTGEELTELVNGLLATPKQVQTKVISALQPKQQDAQKVASPKKAK